MSLNPGSSAPDFTLHSLTPTETDISLSSYKDKKNVVLLFFPQAFTGVCKDELCTVSKPEEFRTFKDKDTEVLAISVDGTFPQKAFAEQNKITVPLLSDFNKEVVKKYDVLRNQFVHGMNGVANRAVYVIDKNGVIKYVEVTENPGVQINFNTLKDAVSKLQ